MTKKIHRRNFVARIGAGLAAMMAFPIKNIAANVDQNDIMKQIDPIIKIKPLGFQWDTLDPFLFCVHHEDHFPKGNTLMEPAVSLADRPLGDDFIIKDGFRMYHGKKIPGFPGHPHRGFETITVVRKGIVDHADSMGASGRYGDGDVQWMTAGKGVQHSEMFPCIKTDEDNPMELFQIWLNLPKKNKMVEPHFKMLWNDSIPRFIHTDKNGHQTSVEIIAGNIGNLHAPTPPPDSWAGDKANQVAVWNIKMDPQAMWKLPKSITGVNRTIYFYQGDKLMVGDKEVPPYHAAILMPEEEVELMNGDTENGILLLQGKPIGEPVIQYGPFVMNTKDEINQAFEDYHNTQFGGWPWPRYDQVHPRDKGRFAHHADGKEELKG